jgi:hypothetical protein
MQRSCLIALLLGACWLSLSAQATPTGSVNISHPLVFSVGLGQAVAPFVYDAEIGFGGTKAGFGIGAIKQQNGAGGGIALKAVILYTWESPVDSPWEDASLVENNLFLENQTYGGLEAVLSPLPYRFALGAYKLLGDIEEGPEVEPANEDDIVWGASFGLGF